MYRIDNFLENIRSKNPGESEFHQAVFEVVKSLEEYLGNNPSYEKNKIL